ncbi:TPA: hypothetical protein JI054_16695 [Acinetobacter baumannii]|jgi:hypothetical protein|uniref:Uncharacterized protein n=9 Tax=Acinetobacter calcoaceticus/baumannii complex TaxID=909768 RepID=A0A0H5FUL4_ACIBA|nr:MULTISPECIES: hypothetical protein [Acinetobacter]EXS22784.1 hypothetical protein J658_2270 [Acinetobacter baumannii 573719]AMN01890.1 hypothetical protein AZE33_11985 [Acinetobacter baumannii]APJ20427.1 hypothetical protein BS064_15455 [Acinetobacter baumannii]AVI34278.1 hypothetical protein CSB70_0774 [Acinetobacter baumannii]AVI39143.1 hypothetical protein CSB68_2451 [Acinetobacter baumannii]
MNAVEFMKEHGIEKARFVIGSAEVGGVVTPKILDLKKLVQSLELIEQIGGVEVAKGKVFIADFNDFKMIKFLIGNKDFVVHIKRVQEAIADHEAVNGNEIDPLIKLKAGLTKLRDKFINDAHALTLLGDLDKSRVYNGIANQLDHLLKGGA